MPSKQVDRVEHSQSSGNNSSRVYKASAAGLAALVAHVAFNFGPMVFVVVALAAIGTYMIAEPNQPKAVDKPAPNAPLPQGHAVRFYGPSNTNGHSAPAHQNSFTHPYPVTKLDTSALQNAIIQTKHQLLPRVSAPLVKNKSLAVLQVGEWLIYNYDALVDYPDHQATVAGVLKQYTPQTLNHYIGLQNTDYSDAQQTTLNSLSLLEEELFRIKKAIVDHRVEELTGHADALQRRFSR